MLKSDLMRGINRFHSPSEGEQVEVGPITTLFVGRGLHLAESSAAEEEDRKRAEDILKANGATPGDRNSIPERIVFSVVDSDVVIEGMQLAIAEARAATHSGWLILLTGQGVIDFLSVDTPPSV